MKNTKKGSSALILLIVIALIVIGVTSYLSFGPKGTVPPEEDLEIKVATTTDIVIPSLEKAGEKVTETPAQKWQTYENKTYKFKFSYPAGWTIGSNIFDGRGEIFALSICPPELTVNGDCKYEKIGSQHYNTYAPFVFFVSPKGSEGSTANNRVVWKRADYTYELDYLTAGYDDLYEEMLPTFKFQ